MHARDGQRAIGKFKRRSRHAEARRLLVEVAASVARHAREGGTRLGFEVAAPLQAVPEFALAFQSCLAGDDLAQRIGPNDARAWLHEVGRRQQRLQSLDARTLPARSPMQDLAQARSDLAWIAWLRPEAADRLRPLAAAVEVLPGWHDGEAAFCHGDFVCSQCLVPPGGPHDDTPWGLTDFDLCHRGDPCRDLAILIASLDEDLPLLADDGARRAVEAQALAEAFLDGHRDEAARRGRRGPDERRLRWQRLCAEIYYLGLMLKKDRYRPALFERRLDRAQRLAGVRSWR
jgi:Ser/Thr protein kinase RdoA (MazF antagonist)